MEKVAIEIILYLYRGQLVGLAEEVDVVEGEETKVSQGQSQQGNSLCLI